MAEDLGAVPCSGALRADELLPAGAPGPRPREYARSGFERGRTCPSGDRTATAAANEETFVMTNMQPQRYALNAGHW
ncbi:MAG TPA: DNA/RNA non-specific endonuclease, partial [Usitatibacter sp.]